MGYWTIGRVLKLVGILAGITVAIGIMGMAVMCGLAVMIAHEGQRSADRMVEEMEGAAPPADVSDSRPAEKMEGAPPAEEPYKISHVKRWGGGEIEIFYHSSSGFGLKSVKVPDTPDWEEAGHRAIMAKIQEQRAKKADEADLKRRMEERAQGP